MHYLVTSNKRGILVLSGAIPQRVSISGLMRLSAKRGTAMAEARADDQICDVRREGPVLYPEHCILISFTSVRTCFVDMRDGPMDRAFQVFGLP